MNRKNLPSLIILDLVVMALAVGLFIFRYRSLQDAATPAPAAAAPAPLASSPVVSLPNMTAAPAVSTAPVEAAPDTVATKQPQAVHIRHIGFAYRNARAKRVEIIGDFNDWTAAPMDLGLDYKWTTALNIPPGEYAYNFVVDGKPVRDPNNPKVCDAGRGYPNSFLKVNSLADDQKKNH